MSGGTSGPVPIRFPAYETLRPVTALAGVVLCDNPSEMTFEGTNTVILRAPGSATSVVVDPGPDDRGHAERIAALAGEVELVVVTHRHADHTDGIDLLRAALAARGGGAGVGAGGRGAAGAGGHGAAGAAGAGGRGAGGVPVRAVLADHCRDAPPLADDEVIRAAGLDLTVLATPGHTADSVCVEVREAGAGFSVPADCVVLGDTILGRDSTVLDSTDGDLGDYLDSLDRLAARADGVTGLPGHGPDVENTARAAEVLAQHRRDRLEQIVAARAELGRDASAAAITQHIYRDVSPFLLMVAEQSTTVALRYLDRLDS